MVQGPCHKNESSARPQTDLLFLKTRYPKSKAVASKRKPARKHARDLELTTLVLGRAMCARPPQLDAADVCCQDKTDACC